MSTQPNTRYVFSTNETIRYRFPTHTNDLVMDRSEAETSEAFMVVLEPGEAPPLHKHDDTEQVFFVVRGAGTLFIGSGQGEQFPVNPGDLVRIPRNALHRIRCHGAEPLVYLSIDCFVEGRPLAEPTWESHVRVMCEQNGWDFDRVRQK
jgi:mannose-6-phosphate isomerase-like protein (cupin superfamily)